MSDLHPIAEILRHFPGVDVLDIVCLGNAGGFSGACLWRITTPAGPLCLRMWPRPHPTEEALRRIHGLLQHARREGMTELPVPLPHAIPLHGAPDTVLSQHQTLYELTPWMPGQADFHARPSGGRLTAAMTVLARFHAASRTFQDRDQIAPGCSPGLVQRRAKLQQLIDGEFHRLATAVAGHPVAGQHDTALGLRAQRLLKMFSSRASDVLQLLNRVAPLKVALQPCLRDIWHDHVLFTGDDVTGVIDFGAIRTENVSCDLARLIGSLVGDNQADWSTALRAYEDHRRLTADEHQLIRTFDQSGVLMSGLSWLQWICVEGRRFEDQPRVLARLDENLLRLEQLGRSV